MTEILVQFVLRQMPEALFLVLAVFAYNRRKVEWKQYLACSALWLISNVLVRMLPIQFGVHTLLGVLLLIGICTYVGKFPLIEALKAALFVTVLLCILDAINLSIAMAYLGSSFEAVMQQVIPKTLWGTPALVAFGVITVCVYKVRTRTKAKEA